MTFTVTSWNDAGKGRAAGGALVSVGGIAVRADATGHLTVQFSRAGTFPVRATLAGTIRSRTIWVHVLARPRPDGNRRRGLRLRGGDAPERAPGGDRHRHPRVRAEDARHRPRGARASRRSMRCAAAPASRRRYGGRFVQAIDGLAGDQSHGMAWLYFINGIQANVGAADYTLHPGDHEWWDYRYWNDLIQVPGRDRRVAGAVRARIRRQAAGGAGRPVRAARRRLAAALRSAGAHVVRRATPFSVRVETFAQAAAGALVEPLAGPRPDRVAARTGAWSSTAAGTDSGPTRRPMPSSPPTNPGPPPGTSAELIVAGDTRASACAAAATLAERPASVRDAYAVALDGSGHVIAYGGRP